MVKIAPKKLSASMEDYLEAIGALVRQGQVARVRDIAQRLGVAMPSVTSALRALSTRGLVKYDPYQVVTLTERGTVMAAKITGRHEALQSFLCELLGVDDEAAAEVACRMEHAVNDDVLSRLRRFAELLQASTFWSQHGPELLAACHEAAADKTAVKEK